MKHSYILYLSIIGFSSIINARASQSVALSATDTKIMTSSDYRQSSDTTTVEPGSGIMNPDDQGDNEVKTLDEVTVSASSVINSKGKTIVYPSASDVNASSTSISLFQKLPLAGLVANPINRTISVDGGVPVILINGVPSSIDDFNALQPKDIKKIEFSRNTPARYADSGKNGLLSITLKGRKDGGRVYAWGRSAVNTAFVDANIGASYHQGASQFSLQYRPSWRNYQQVYDNTSESFIAKNFHANLEIHDRNPFNYHTHALQLKYDFSPSEKTLFSATFNATPFKNKSRSIAHTIDSELGEYDNNNMSRSKDFTPSLDLFIHQDFNDKNSLEAQVVGTLSSSDYRRDNNYIFANGLEDSYIMNVDSRRRSLISEVSYIHTFSKRTQLSAGYQNTISRNRNYYLSSDYKPILTENNNYAYIRLEQSVGRFHFSFDTGAKMFWINNDLNRRHFIRNLSSVQISWNINPNWSLNGSFFYSPTIPTLTALTDYPQQTSPYIISNGNPELKVAENFVYNLGASYNYKKFSASFRSCFINTNKSVINDISYLGDGRFLSCSVNARYNRVFRNELTFGISDIYGFGANLYMQLTNYDTAGADWSHSLTSFDGNITLWWTKGPFTISYWRVLPGKYLDGHYVGKGENGDALQFEWRPDKHWTLGASWMYMFDKKGTRYPAWNYSTINPSYRERYIKNNSNMVVLSVSYSADFGTIFRTARRNLNNYDNGSSLLRL